MGPRVGLSSVLILGAIVLLVAIAVGQNMGNRVLGQIASRPGPLSATPIPTPTATSAGLSGRASAAMWKRHDVISVATDPGFPDPRVTPEPPPPEPPRPTARPTPRRTSTPEPSDDGGDAAPRYTSPPMPIPLVTHGPEEPSPPDQGGLTPEPANPTATATGRGAASVPSRATPTIPPYSTPLP